MLLDKDEDKPEFNDNCDELEYVDMQSIITAISATMLVRVGRIDARLLALLH